jgi:hypothetical protein
MLDATLIFKFDFGIFNAQLQFLGKKPKLIVKDVKHRRLIRVSGGCGIISRAPPPRSGESSEIPFGISKRIGYVAELQNHIGVRTFV